MKKSRDEVAEIFERAFSGPDGQLAWERLESLCGIGADIFTKDHAHMSYLAGRQSVFLELKALMKRK